MEVKAGAEHLAPPTEPEAFLRERAMERVVADVGWGRRVEHAEAGAGRSAAPQVLTTGEV